MSARLLSVVAALAAGAVAAAARADEPSKEHSKEEVPPSVRALLVGCTKYDHLRPTYWLEGPGNDVALFRRVLADRFGVPADRITILSEESGLRPTRDNIERAFRRLADETVPGDHVVVLLAGHGSRQPDDGPRGGDPEPDRLDELFLPADVRGWNGTAGRVAKAIVDDEIGAWVAAIAAKAESVWLIVDACHSGTLLRGDEVEREVPSEELGVPAAKGPAGDPSQDDAPLVFEVPDRVVSMYAALPSEKEPEGPMPPDHPGGPAYGLFTYTLCQTLATSPEPPTYEEVMRSVRARYAAWGRQSPTPVLEGNGVERVIFGSRVRAAARTFLLRAEDDEWRIDGGRLHGLTPGTVLAMVSPDRQPPAGAGGTDGYIEVKEADVADSTVRPCAYGGVAAPASLQAGRSCRVVALGARDWRLPVKVLDGGDAAAARQAADVLRRASTSGSLFRIAESSEAKWVLQPGSSQRLSLLPKSRASRRPDARDGAPPGVSASITDLPHVLNGIARAQNLLDLAGADDVSRSLAPGDGLRPAIEVEMRLFGGREDRVGRPLPETGAGPRVAPGNWIGWRVANEGTSPLDVNLLFIDAGHGIHCVLPRRGSALDNRFAPGYAAVVGPFRVTPEPLGREYLITVVTPGVGPPTDFSFLEQPRLEGPDRAGLDPPVAFLADQFEAALYTGEFRTLALDEPVPSSITAMGWSVAEPPSP